MIIKNYLNQFNYLINTSRKIISEFGFRYFLNFGILQLKNQKFEIFKPHERILDISTSESQIDLTQQYLLWKKNQKNVYSNFDELLPLHFSPPIKIILIINEQTSKESITSTLNSVRNQTYIYWSLSIYISDKKHYPLIQEFINENSEHNVTVSLKQDCGFKNFISHLNIQETFTLFITGTITLEQTCLYFMVKSLNHGMFDLVYSDEERFSVNDKEILPFFKPDWSSYFLLNFNYIGNCFLVKNNILEKLIDVEGFFSGDFFDLVHQFTDLAKKIHHISLVLFKDSSTSYFNPVLYPNIVSKSIKRKNIDGVCSLSHSNLVRVHFTLQNEPKVSIIIPTKDNKELLSKCIRSIEYNTDYKNYEIIIVDNNSEDSSTQYYLSSLPYLVINFEKNFNFSDMNNLAVSKSTGDFILLLNDDTEAIEPNWLTEMVSICQQDNVGAVGAKLLYRDNTIQHAGMAYLQTGYFFHPFQKKLSDSNYYFNLINSLRETSSVTGACLLIKKQVFEEIEKLNPKFDVYYGDSDICFKIQQCGLKVIYTPFSVLRHDGSTKIKTFSPLYIPVENYVDFINSWPLINSGDPFYNKNLTFDYNIDYVKDNF